MVYRDGGQERQLVTACCLNWRWRAKLKLGATIKLLCRLTVKCFEIANCGNTQTVIGNSQKLSHSICKKEEKGGSFGWCPLFETRVTTSDPAWHCQASGLVKKQNGHAKPPPVAKIGTKRSNFVPIPHNLPGLPRADCGVAEIKNCRRARTNWIRDG